MAQETKKDALGNHCRVLRAKPSFPYPYLKCAVSRPSWALGQPQMLFDLHVRLSLLFDRRSEKHGFRLLLDCARKRKQLTLRWAFCDREDGIELLDIFTARRSNPHFRFHLALAHLMTGDCLFMAALLRPCAGYFREIDGGPGAQPSIPISAART